MRPPPRDPRDEGLHVGELAEGREGRPLGIQEHQGELSGPMGQRQAGQHRSGQRRLARPRGPGDQDVGDLRAGQADQQRRAVRGQPEEGGVER
jgi:hypothetical protein